MTAQAKLRADVAQVVKRESDGLIDLSHRIHGHPEVAWEEERASGWVADAMADGGFAVTRPAYGLATAVEAVRGTGPLTVVVCAEYDALPGLGHACGHNVIAASSVGTALALGEVADELGIRVKLLGTPAEEGAGGKLELLARGAFDGAHLALMAHPGPVDVARAEAYAVSHLKVAYEGKAAHAAAYPDLGVNASDAFTVAQVALALLRQQLPSDSRVHGIVTHGGDAPNVIPDRTEGHWYVRGTTLDQMHEVEARVRKCFEAGALATECALSISSEGQPYADFRNDTSVLTSYVANAEGLGRQFASVDDPARRMNRASTDMGNVSQVLPAIHPYIGIDSLPAVNHQPEFAAAAASAAADGAVLDAATALALTVVDVVSDSHERERLLAGSVRLSDA
ncbi:MAG: M20 family metallopeptidase [Actinomycetes bacterium]